MLKDNILRYIPSSSSELPKPPATVPTLAQWILSLNFCHGS